MTFSVPINLRFTPYSIAQLQTNYLAFQFGCFHHFSMATFCNQEVPASNQNPNTFNPSSLNTDQWLSNDSTAKAKYAVYTCKHEDGWCNWNTATTIYNITQSSWYAGNGTDVVSSFVSSCRKFGIIPILYLCAKDNWFEANNPGFTQAQYKSYLQSQLTELASYGGIGGIWLDADNTSFFPSMGYPWASCAEANTFINSLQKQKIIAVNNAQGGSGTLTDSNIVEYEGGTSPGEFVPPGNTTPAESSETIYNAQQWFYNTFGTAFRSTSTLIANIALANSRTSNYLINFPPDTTGQIPSNMISVMATIGAR